MNHKKRLEALHNRANPQKVVFTLRVNSLYEFEYAGQDYRLTDTELDQFKADNPDLFIWHEEHTEHSDEYPL